MLRAVGMGAGQLACPFQLARLESVQWLIRRTSLLALRSLIRHKSLGGKGCPRRTSVVSAYSSRDKSRCMAVQVCVLMEDIMGMVKQDDGWRLPDELWEQMAPLLPPRKPHPLGCHNPRVPDRAAMNAIFFVLRTGCQWNALNATGICSSTSAYRRFREWLDAGVFEEFWRLGLLAADALEEIDWTWLSLDGAMTKAPLGGEKNRPQSYGSRQRRGQAQPAH